MAKRPDPMKLRAHRAVKAAIQAGQLPAPTRCEACGVIAGTVRHGRPIRVVYHHWRGYEGDAATDVAMLCDSDHFHVHEGWIPDPRLGTIRPDARKLRDGGPYATETVVRAIIEGRDYAPYITPGCFTRTATILGLRGGGSVLAGARAWLESAKAKAAARRERERIEREKAWAKRRVEREARVHAEALEFTRVVLATGDSKQANRHLGHPVSREVRAMARTAGLLAWDGRRYSPGPSFPQVEAA